MNMPINYRISILSAEAHLFEVTLTVAQPDRAGQVFQLPAWIPGSYMIRDFCRHIVMLTAESAALPVAIKKLDKHTWRANPVDGELVVHYQVYAYDLSVRGAYLDTQRGFFNGTSLCLLVAGKQHSPCDVEIVAASGPMCSNWKVATTLQAITIDNAGFGHYRSADYDELIDSPVEIGRFSRLSFDACGVPHEFVISGHFQADLERLVQDVKRICEWHINFFGKPAPFDRYMFILFVCAQMHGGLEHRASAALIAGRDCLPAPAMKEISDNYLQLLRLISHEYFHSWNIKRIKPAVFIPYDLSCENHTRLLWAFEGITSYYEALALMRCGLIDQRRYLGLVAKTITSVMRGNGHTKQTLEEASFDAWTKYYRQDENSPNSLVSYYTKGSLVALALDLVIRRETGDTKSLDDVMQALWAHWLQNRQGITEEQWEDTAAAATGLNLTSFFELALRSTQEIPLAELLATQGVGLAFDTPRTAEDHGSVVDTFQPCLEPPPSLGARYITDMAGVRLTHVLDGGAAQAAGLSGGDVIIAIDHLKVTDLEQQLARFSTGDQVCLHYFRRDELMVAQVTLLTCAATTCRLSITQPGSWLTTAVTKVTDSQAAPLKHTQ